MMITLSRPQRAGYLLSMLFLSAGWVLLLALILQLPLAQWSRLALALQAPAFLVARWLVPRVLAKRLLAYPLILAASIYLVDTTLPPPTFPVGWPRELLPRLVLGGLVIDWLWTIQQRRREQLGILHRKQQHVALPDAARCLGLSAADLRTRIRACRGIIRRDAAGREYVSTADLHTLQRRSTPAWWALVGWVLLMSGVVLLAVSLVVPTAWETVALVVWCSVTLGGMGVWVRANRGALSEDDWTPRAAHQQHDPATRGDAGRTIPLSPVQARYLAVMQREQDHQVGDRRV